MEAQATTTLIEMRSDLRAFLAPTFAWLPMGRFVEGSYHISELRPAGHRGSEEDGDGAPQAGGRRGLPRVQWNIIYPFLR